MLSGCEPGSTTSWTRIFFDSDSRPSSRRPSQRDRCTTPKWRAPRRSSSCPSVLLASGITASSPALQSKTRGGSGARRRNRRRSKSCFWTYQPQSSLSIFGSTRRRRWHQPSNQRQCSVRGSLHRLQHGPGKESTRRSLRKNLLQRRHQQCQNRPTKHSHSALTLHTTSAKVGFTSDHLYPRPSLISHLCSQCTIPSVLIRYVVFRKKMHDTQAYHSYPFSVQSLSGQYFRLLGTRRTKRTINGYP